MFGRKKEPRSDAAADLESQEIFSNRSTGLRALAEAIAEAEPWPTGLQDQERYRVILRCLDSSAPADIPEILLTMGFSQAGGELPTELIESYFEILGDILRPDPPYTFGEDEDLYNKLFELGMANVSMARDIDFPKDIVFIDRTLGGHFGNLCKLQATGPWRELLSKYVVDQ